MSRNIWISSDLHYNHEKILSFTDHLGRKTRSFSDVENMNEYLIDMHNSVVKPGDIYYCLGDVFFGAEERFKRDWPKFKGKKRLVVGNHDDIKFLSSGGFFSKVLPERTFGEHSILMTHRPIHESSLFRGKDQTAPMLNVHGHTHTMGSPEGTYHSVCVEMIDYTPINLDELIAIAAVKRQQWREANAQ